MGIQLVRHAVFACCIVLGAVGAMAQEDRTPAEDTKKITILDPQTGRVRVDVPGAVDGNLSEVGAKEIKAPKDWKESFELSKREPVLIFKHSTTCPISGGAYRRLAKYIQDSGDDAPKTFLVKVIETRPVSQQIEKEAKVKHESPQILLLEDGEVKWHTSHEDITEKSVKKAVKQVRKAEKKERS